MDPQADRQSEQTELADGQTDRVSQRSRSKEQPTRQAHRSKAKAFCLFACAPREAQSTRSLRVLLFVYLRAWLDFKKEWVVISPVK